MVKVGGAQKVHVRIGGPPIIALCDVGIDMSSQEKLIAAYKTIPNVEAVINTDSLGYVSNEGLAKAIGLPEENLCMGCLNSVLPLVNTG